MHAGGVAESSAPWNDEKDPFEVLSLSTNEEIYLLIPLILSESEKNL